MSVDRGEWLLTFTGRQFFPLAPRVEDVCIEDIAHALSMICRFGGHTREYYSVGSHSIHVSRIVPPQLALTGLLHDATEAYFSDMIKPVKRMFPEYSVAEHRLWKVIAERYGLPETLPDEVKVADNVALMTERRDFINRGVDKLPWKADEEGVEPDGQTLFSSAPQYVERDFLKRFGWLGGR